MRLPGTLVFQSAITVIGFLSIIGCKGAHSELVPVSGHVSIDGKPLAVGQVASYPKGHRASFGKLDSEGHFTLTCYLPGDGVPIGQHIATVTAVQSIDEHSNRWFAPKKYANTATGVWVTIDGPTKDLKVDLTWAGSNQNSPFVDKF